MPTLDDRYELATELGRGSTGTVWEAWDRSASRTVAVKVLEPALLASPTGRKRFLRETEMASRLRHPHSVEVLSHGATPENGAYLVMERLAGETLAQRLRNDGPLSQRRAIKIIAEVLDAVLAAHRLGIVHRDLKPSNVMLIERDGDRDFVKVCDFGLAKAIEPEVHDSVRDGGAAMAIDLASVATEQGQICGTPEYMAPEQARGEPIDARADLYSVAVMLFHAVVGRPPFMGRSPLAVVSLHLTAVPPRPSELRPDLSIFPPLENLVLRGLAKDRAERPSSAEVFRSDLLQIERDYTRWIEKGMPSLSRFPSDSDTLPAAPAPVRSAPPRRTRVAALVATGIATSVMFVAWWRDGVGSASMAAAARPSVTSMPEPPPSFLTRVENARADSATPVSPKLVSNPPALPETRARIPEPKTKVASKPLLAQATEALARGQVVEACALGETAAAEAPASAAVWKFLGQCFMRLGDREKGTAYYRRYLELAPSSSDALFVREMIK